MPAICAEAASYFSWYFLASRVNASTSRQCFWDRYAMNALKVYGGGALLFNTSSNVGFPPGGNVLAWSLGIAKLIGLVGLVSSPDIVNSSSMFPFRATGASRGEVSGVYGQTTDETAGCVFLVIIALSLLGTPRP